jgi:hypothetical protein
MKGVVDKGYRAGRPNLLDAQINRTGALVGRGDHARATDEAEALARQDDLSSMNLYNVACTFSRSSAAADHDTKLSPADRTRLKAHYAERAMDFLRQSIAKGLPNPRLLKTDPDMKPLQMREDFQKLLADLERETKE